MLSKNNIEIGFDISEIFKPKDLSVDIKGSSLLSLVNEMKATKKEDVANRTNLPKRYIINKGATILFWEDGTKTIVRKCKEDKYDKRIGFLTAFFQKYSGLTKNKANKFLSELREEEPKE